MAAPSAMLPYYTSNDLIAAIQRKIAMPLSQQTFSADDLLRFANEEMFLGLVPSMMLYHQEYMVFPVVVPLVGNNSRYSIPDRSVGIRFRDVFYQDTQVPPNLFEMARVDADDKAFYQRNVGANTSIHKFYIEGNDIVLMPQLEGDAIGSLVFYIYLRPNQLVQNSRAATCTSITNSLSSIPLNFLSNSTFIQINPTNTITIPNHGLVNGNKVQIISTGLTPNGISDGALYYIISSTTNTFQLSTTIGGSAVVINDVGTGLQTITRIKYLTELVLPQSIDFTTDTLTITNNDYANNDQVMLYNIGGKLPTPFSDNTIYYIVGRTQDTIQLSTTIGGTPVDITFNGTGDHYVSSNLTTVGFDQLPSNIQNNTKIDFLQTSNGHKTFAYDVLIPTNGISGTSITFLYTDVPNQSIGYIQNHYVGPFGPEGNNCFWDHWFACQNGTAYYYAGTTQALSNAEIPGQFAVGDYICSANECIIPQTPSDLHNGLAERAAARILASLGDQAGLQASQQKINEINAAQGTLLDQRSEGNGMKITARHSLLRYGRFYGRRRV